MLASSETYIVKKGHQYLVGRPYDDTSFVRFSTSPYDGYPFDDFLEAWHIARRMNGRVWKHNRATGTLEGGWK